MTTFGRNLPEVLALNGRYRRHETALDDAGGTASYGELVEAMEGVAAGLRTRLATGDRVAFGLAPSAPYIASVMASMSAGMVACPINTRLAVQEARAYIEVLEPSMIVTDRAHESWASELGLDVIVIDDGSDRSSLSARLSALSSAKSVEIPPLSGDAPAMIYGTGGTTGVPKGAVYTHDGVHRAVWSYAVEGKRSSTTIEVTCAPFFHLGFMAPLATLFFGGKLIVPHKYEPEAVIEAIASGVTVVGAGAPTVWTSLREHPAFEGVDRSGIRHVIYGTMPTTPEFARQICDDYPRAEIISGFGSTETGFATCATRRDLEAGRTTGVGRPLAGVSVRVVDDHGVEVPAGEVGELAITTPWGATGYWNMPEATAETWTDEGVRLGDLGVVAEDGWLTIVGRKKDMIISGGENVFPPDIENVLIKHPRIVAVAVYGVDDERWGQRIEAAVVTDDGEALDVDELRTWGRDNIASYKLPRTVRIVDVLPTTAVGKIDRLQLQRMAEGSAIPSTAVHEANSGSEAT